MKIKVNLPDGSSMEFVKEPMSEDKAEMVFAGLMLAGVIALFVIAFTLIAR